MRRKSLDDAGVRVAQFVAYTILEAPIRVWLETTQVNGALDVFQALSIDDAASVGCFGSN